MIRTRNVFLGACFALATLAQPAFSQSQFQVRAQQGQIVQNLANDATLTFASEGVGQAVVATATMTYRGTTPPGGAPPTVVIGAFELTGATGFSVTTSPPLPVTLGPNETLNLIIQFNPTVLGRQPGRLSIAFTEGRTTGSFNINLVGVTPEFGFSFALPRGNQNSILPGGTITFPDTTINTTTPTSATFVISNRGAGPGTIQNITVNGAAFTLGGVPLLPAVVQPNQEVRIAVNFSPTQLAAATGQLRIEFVQGSATMNLTGIGMGPAYSYELVTAGAARPIAPDETLSPPQTNISERNSVIVRVRNTGNADGSIADIRVTGAAEFTVSDVPFLPAALTPGAGLSFTLNFAPTQPGTVAARLRIGDAFFNLSGVGLGSTLTYAVTVGSASTIVANNGSIILPPTQVGATSTATFQISNTGNTPAFVNSISVTGAPFTLTGMPALPARVGGGESLSFSIIFTPTVVGSATSSLKVDAQTFNISAVGSDPPALPGVAFAGAPASADPATQVSLGLILANPYPVNLTGRLVLAFASDVFADDPAIQFAVGGRTLPFVIPANTTRALFGVSATDVRLQTGTVAGTITLAATFATEAGNINLTPTALPATTIAVRPSAPRLRSVQLSARTASSFTILVTGYAPTRTVTQMAFTFTATVDPNNKDLKLDTTSLNMNVEGPFGAWYQSTASTPFGSQFTASVTFNVRGDVEAIQSVAVTASNALGASGSMSVNLR